ncbi:MAG: hypothetical protein WDM81_13575 [Rhizomicrobium sp.]
MYARLPAVLDRVAKARQTDTHAYPGLPATREDFDKFVAGRVQRESAELGATLARPTDGEFGGAFLGGIAASFTDPVNQLLLPFGAARGAGVLRTMATEAALGAGSVAAAAPSVALWRDQVGLDYTAEDFFGNMATAAAAGGLLGGGLKLAGHVIAKLAPIGKMTPSELVAHTADLPMTPEQRAARDLVQAQVDTLGSNPLADTHAGREEHVARLSEALDAVISGRPQTQGDPLTPVLDHEAFAGSADPEVRAQVDRVRAAVARIDTARERIAALDNLGEQARALEQQAAQLEATGAGESPALFARLDDISGRRLQAIEDELGGKAVTAKRRADLEKKRPPSAPACPAKRRGPVRPSCRKPTRCGRSAIR